MDHAQMATCHAKASDRTTGNSTEAASRPPLSSSSGGAANEWRSGMRFGRRHSVAQAVDSDAGNDANRGAQGEIGHQLRKSTSSLPHETRLLQRRLMYCLEWPVNLTERVYARVD